MSQPTTAQFGLPFQSRELSFPQVNKTYILAAVALTCGVAAVCLFFWSWLQFGRLSSDEVLISAGSEVSTVAAAESSTAESPDESYMIVDVSGGVTSPGIYTLPSGSRVADAVAAAGGIAKTADRAVLAREINLAAAVQDAEKIYIPLLGDAVHVPLAAAGGTSSTTSPVTNELSAQISISSASQIELEALEGIGEKRAAAIIAGRPYTSLSELVSRKILTPSLYATIEDELRL